MMMLVCFEGPQKVGKSTLIKMFMERVDPPIPLWERPAAIEAFKEKNGCYDLFVMDELSIFNKINWSKVDMLVDRHPAISEWVYSSLLSRPSIVQRTELSLLVPCSCFIYLRRKWKELDKRVEQATYDAVMQVVRQKFPVLVLRTDKMNKNQCLEEIELFVVNTRYSWRGDIGFESH